MTAAAKGKPRARLMFTLRIVAGLAILFALLRFAGWSEIASELQGARWRWICLVYVSFAVMFVLNARLQLNLLRGVGLTITAARVMLAKFQSSFFGLILPEIRLTDNASLPSGTYVVRIQGVEQARDRLYADKVLALLTEDSGTIPAGDDVKEPVYGAPARWIAAADEHEMALSGITLVNPTEVLATHLLEILKRNFARLLGLKALRKLLDEMTSLTDPARSEANRRIIDELIPDRVPIDLLLTTLRLLLEERVSIRNLPLILEAIAEIRPVTAAPDAVCEHVRQRLGFQLVAELRRNDGTLPLVQLAPEWEQQFSKYQLGADGASRDIALPPEDFNRLANAMAERIAKASESGIYPAVVTSTRRRRFLKTVLTAKGVPNPVLSFEEIGTEARPSIVGLVPA